MADVRRQIDALPERGWGLLVCDPVVVLVLWGYEVLKVHITPVPGTYQVRLTGKGRRWRRGIR